MCSLRNLYIDRTNSSGPWNVFDWVCVQTVYSEPCSVRRSVDHGIILHAFRFSVRYDGAARMESSQRTVPEEMLRLTCRYRDVPSGSRHPLLNLRLKLNALNETASAYHKTGPNVAPAWSKVPMQYHIDHKYQDVSEEQSRCSIPGKSR
jgi:hypothetical protein